MIARLALLASLLVTTAAGLSIGGASSDLVPATQPASGILQTGGAPDDPSLLHADTSADFVATADDTLSGVVSTVGSTVAEVVATAEDVTHALPTDRSAAEGATRAASPSREPISPVPSAAAAGGSALLVGLLAWLVRLLPLAPMARLFSRIEPDAVLEHPTRNALHAALEAEPGLAMKDLQERLGIAWGTLVHHLRRLEAAGAVVSARRGAARCWFVAHSAPSRHRRTLIELVHPTARRIAQLVDRRPGIDQSGVCAALGLRAPAASKHLGRFRSAGLVTAEKDGRRVRYAPTASLTTALQMA